jgi:protein PhnA
MAKGFQANKERIEAIAAFGKSIGKRAGFTCEWCGGRDDLRLWEYRPDMPPNMETLALLCRQCRDLAGGKKADPDELRSIRNALWSTIPAVAEGAATVLARCHETWVRDAIEQSFMDDTIKTRLLAQSQIWK